MKLTFEVKRTDQYRLKNSACFLRFLAQYKMKFVNFVPKTIIGSKKEHECRSNDQTCSTVYVNELR